MNFLSSSLGPTVESMRYKTTSASVARFFVSSTPRASITSSVWRRPAVSKRRTGIPLMLAQLSSQSRVVPSMSLTIARSSFRIALKRDDFPAFVRPAKTTRAPSWYNFSLFHESTRDFRRFCANSKSERSKLSAIVSSSSGYSISTSIAASVSMINFLIESISSKRLPARRPTAWEREASV